MSMLAERRTKQKFVLNPRGTQWSNDDSKLGQKLMESMGWSKGQGLGANKDGNTDPLRVTLKNDMKGVGFTVNHEDNWLIHQDDYNTLLSDLKQAHTPDSPAPADTRPKVASLEQKSKSSKSRVHYHKFTKGKDLSLKSETDLDCVLGKRKSKLKSESNTSTSQSEVNSDASGDEKTLHGVKTVTSSSNLQEYFARKMAQLKNDSVNTRPTDRGDNSMWEGQENGKCKYEEENGAELGEETLGTGKTKAKKRKISDERQEELRAANQNESSLSDMGVKNKKKRKKSETKTSICLKPENEPVDEEIVEPACEDRKKKKKREKWKTNTSICLEPVNELHVVDEEILEPACEDRKKKKRERQINSDMSADEKTLYAVKTVKSSDNLPDDSASIDSRNTLPTDRRGNSNRDGKKSRKCKYEEENGTELVEETPGTGKTKAKKRKISVERQEEISATNQDESSLSDIGVKKKKKRKKSVANTSICLEPENELVDEEIVEPACKDRKKKKKREKLKTNTSICLKLENKLVDEKIVEPVCKDRKKKKTKRERSETKTSICLEPVNKLHVVAEKKVEPTCDGKTKEKTIEEKTGELGTVEKPEEIGSKTANNSQISNRDTLSIVSGLFIGSNLKKIKGYFGRNPRAKMMKKVKMAVAKGDIITPQSAQEMTPP